MPWIVFCFGCCPVFTGPRTTGSRDLRKRLGATPVPIMQRTPRCQEVFKTPGEISSETAWKENAAQGGWGPVLGQALLASL